MCYLPKATFYLYFGFFFVGYIWIFGLLFYRTMFNQAELEKAAEQQQQQHLNNIMNTDNKVSQNYQKSEINSNIPPKLRQMEISLLNIYELRQPVKEIENATCVDLAETQPKFFLCIHDPKIDRGLSAYVNLHKTWEPEVTLSLSKLFGNSPNNSILFVDVGANVGYFSLFAAKMGFNVIAIEPFLDNVKLFHKSAVLNNVQDRITVANIALGDKRGLVKFVDSSDNVGGRFYLDFDEPKYESSAKLDVRMILMNDLLKLDKLSVPNKEIVLKFDVEGKECFILDRADRFLKELKIKAIYVEWTDSRTLRSELCNKRMVKILKSRHFKPYSFDGIDLSDRLDFKQERINMPPNFLWLPQS